MIYMRTIYSMKKSNTVSFNTVTWYSKLLALVLFALMPFVGFLVGRWYGQVEQASQERPAVIQNY